MGEALRGTDIVFSRKPDPTSSAWTSSSTRKPGPPTSARRSRPPAASLVEFIVRDVYTVHGNLAKPRRAVELARRELDRAGF